MKLMLVGAGAVGKSIAKMVVTRDPKGEWLKEFTIADYNEDNAKAVAEYCNDKRIKTVFINARDIPGMVEIMKKSGCDFVMDATGIDTINNVFEAAYEADAGYANMATSPVAVENPKYGSKWEDNYEAKMLDFHFSRSEAWAKKGLQANVCLGVEPGMINVFAKFAAENLFDELHEIHIRDAANIQIPNLPEGEVVFPFNVYTVLEEVMDPNLTYDEDEGGFYYDRPWAGEEVYNFPVVGPQKLYKILHEEVELMPHYLKKYGLRKVDYKIGLDDDLVNALKVLDTVGMRSIREVDVNGVKVIPREVVGKTAAQPLKYAKDMIGTTCGGIHCVGIKDGMKRELFMYNTFDNQESIEKWGTQAVVAQTAAGAVPAIELVAKGIWKEAGVHGPENFDPIPYLEIMKEYGFNFKISELDSEYKEQQDEAIMNKLFEEAKAKSEAK